MQSSRFSTLFLATTLGLLSAACTSGSADSDASAGGGPGGGGDDGGGGGDPPALSTESLDEIDLDADVDGDRIVDLPESVDEAFLNVFSRYAALETSTGRIHLLAQSGVSNDKIRRTREVLRQQLTPVAGAAQGADKESVIAAMVANGAAAGLFDNAAALNLNDPEIATLYDGLGQNAVAIPANRIILEGSPEYVATLPAEDNTFGVLAALVFRSGLRSASPAYAAELDGLAADAIASGAYTPRADIPEAELTAAYLEVAMDVHGGIFGHNPDGNGIADGVAGMLTAIDRDDLGAALPGTKAWIESFFATDHTLDVLLPLDFTGNFSGLFRTSIPYTARSQYLRNITLTGSNSAEIFAAPFDSTIRGNAGPNRLKGRAGFDTLYGGDGFDTAVFSGPQSNYTIEILSDRIIVEDVIGGHDHADTLFGIERLQFSDGGFNL